MEGNRVESGERKTTPATITDVASGARRRTQRLEELRHSLTQKNGTTRAYALQTLLSLLWVESGTDRLPVAAALLGYPPQSGVNKGEAPPAAVRLCARIARAETSDDLPPPPAPDKLHAWIENAAIGLLTATIDTLKQMARAPQEPPLTLVQQETDVCMDVLALARTLRSSAASEGCVRLLRLFPPELARDPGPVARQTLLLREAACRTLGALPPDSLFPLWYALGSPDETARRDLLPVLDYLRDARVIPNLIKILDRRGQWSDGNVAGWFIVRAFARFNDRAAIPALRRVASGASNTNLRKVLPWLRGEKDEGTTNDLAREARRVIQSIETGTGNREGHSLLRSSSSAKTNLLHPATPAPSSEECSDLLRPTDPEK